MNRIVMALVAGLLAAGSFSARADEPNKVAIRTDAPDFEIIAVKPRNPDVKPIIASIPVAGVDQSSGVDKPRS